MKWDSREKILCLRKDTHDKLSSIFERSETDCIKPVMMPIFSNSSCERPSPSSNDSQIASPLRTLSLEISVKGTPRKIQMNLDILLPSNTTRTEFRINVADISSYPEKIGIRVRK